MGAPLGNRNASKENRLWGDAIKRAVAQNDGQKLRELADRLIERAAEGDVAALRELGDRLDGKAKQQVEATGADGGAIQIVVTSDDSGVV